MTLILKLEPDVEAGLAAMASAKGLSLDLYVRNLLKQFAVPISGTEMTPEQKAAAFEQLIEGLPEMPLTPTSCCGACSTAAHRTGRPETRS